MGKNKALDSLDKKIIQSLAEDGRMTVKDLVSRLGITSPTLQSRIKQLIQSGVLKIAGLLNPFKIPGLTMAIVAVRVENDEKLDEKLEQISELEEVHCVYAVTGQYDLIIEVVFSGGMESLYNFMSRKLPDLGNISYSESFVVMKAKKKWILQPPNLKWPL